MEADPRVRPGSPGLIPSDVLSPHCPAVQANGALAIERHRLIGIRENINIRNITATNIIPQATALTVIGHYLTLYRASYLNRLTITDLGYYDRI